MKFRGELVLLLSLWLLPLSLVHAKVVMGPRVGNGGGVWLCRAAGDTEIKWIELTDLFEAQHEIADYELAPVQTDDPWQIFWNQQKFITEYVPQLGRMISPTFSNLGPITSFTPATGMLTIIDDGLYNVRPELSTCPDGHIDYVQIANYTDNGHLLISGGLWAHPKFSTLEQGALLTHELVYKALRESAGDRTSWRARKIVGILFSTFSDFQKAIQINSVLSTPAPLPTASDVSLATAPMTCVATIQRRNEPAENYTLIPLLSSLSIDVKGLRFTLLLEPADNGPVSMSILDATSGVRTQLGKEQVDYLLLSRGYAELKYDNFGTGVSAVLRCAPESITPFSLFK